jgi:hypothetical protein
MSENFSQHRLKLLLRNDIVSDYRSHITSSSVMAIIIIVSSIISVGFGHIEHDYYLGWFIGMLFIWGTITASCIFNELHDKSKNEAYLLLPASTLEKTIARVIYITVFFVTYLLLFTMLVSLVTEGTNLLLFGRHNSLFNPFSLIIWEAIVIFLVIQSLFFLGAAWFRSLHWFKTVISISAIGSGLSVVALISFRIFYADFFIGPLQPSPDIFVAITNNFSSNMGLYRSILLLCNILFFVVLAPFCWFVAWMRIKETQVTHGI